MAELSCAVLCARRTTDGGTSNEPASTYEQTRKQNTTQRVRRTKRWSTLYYTVQANVYYICIAAIAIAIYTYYIL